MRKKFVILIVSMFFVGLPFTFVLAADMQALAASHDGQVRKIGPHNVELVANDGSITLYFTDDNNNKISTEFGRAMATIRYVGERQTISVDLKTSEGNTLKGSGDFEIKADTTIVVFTKLNGEDAHGGRFELNSTKEPEVNDHHHDDHDHGHDNHHDDHDSHHHGDH